MKIRDETRDQREIRAARNQALFRTVNEQMRTLSERFDQLTEITTIACECADTNCVSLLTIQPAEYEQVRASPRRFVVLPDHVYSYVETVVGEADGYVVVEKFGAAVPIVENAAPVSSGD